MLDKHPFELNERHKRLLAGLSFFIFLALFLAVAWFIGRPMVRFVQEPELFRNWVDDHGIWGNLAFLGMMFLQVVIAVIPGEPLEIGAGYAFGFWEGTLLCLLGIFFGSAVVFLLVRRFGTHLVEVFFDSEKIHSLKFLQESKKRDLLIFLVMFIPGTPKDLLSYFAGLTDIKLGRWLLITTVARIPSVVTSTVGGNAVGEQNYLFAVLIFVSTLAVSALGLFIYQHMSKRKKDE